MSSITGILTGGLIDPGGGSTSRFAIQREKQRQALIGSGTGLINAIFGGGSAPMYSPVTSPITRDMWGTGEGHGSSLPTYTTIGKKGTFDPYFGQRPGAGGALDAQGVTSGALLGMFGGIGGIAAGAMGLGDNLFGGDTPSYLKMLNKKINQGNLFTQQDQTYKGFTPDFFNQRQQDYVNFATPQLAQQYHDAFRSIMYNLANRGLTNSSQANVQKSRLDLTTGQAQQGIADEGIRQKQMLQNTVETSRQNALQQLQQASDPGQAASIGLAAANNAQQPSTFQPLSNIFSNLANQYYMNQVLNNYRNTAPPLSLNNSPSSWLAPTPGNS